MILGRSLYRRIATLALALLFVVGAVAPARSAEPYDINVVISLTGPGAFLGQAAAQSIGAIEKLVNATGGIKGRPVHFVIADDQTAPSVAVQLTAGLIAKKVPVILGSAVGATCSAMASLFKNGPVQYCFAPVIHPVAPSYVFSAGASTRDLSLAGLRWARLHGIKKIAFLDATDTTGQDGEAVSRANLALPEFAGVQLVANEHFNVSDINVNAQLARIKASGAELLYAQTVGTPFGTVLKDAYDMGLDLPILTNAGNINFTQMTQYAAFLPKDVYFTGYRYLEHETAAPGPVRDAQRQFITAMNAVGVPKPDFSHNFAWDATMIVVDALRHLGTGATPEQIRQYIVALHGYDGINGIMDFRDGQQRGLTTNAALVVRWSSEKHEFVAASRPGGFALASPSRLEKSHG
jgi:branched-chain amino acid transport system substrate-binding protein